LSAEASLFHDVVPQGEEMATGRSESRVHRLFEKAKRGQWNAATDVPWHEPASPDGRIIADALVDLSDRPVWAELSEIEKVDVNRYIAAWRLEAVRDAECAAFLACGQMLSLVPHEDARAFLATQMMDEARHAAVLERYISQRIGVADSPGSNDALAPYESLFGDSCWYRKTIALQLVTETVAAALLGTIKKGTPDPVLRQICHNIATDEARHIGFGMLSIPAVMSDVTSKERDELEDYTCDAIERAYGAFFTHKPYRGLGFSKADLETEDPRGVYRKAFDGAMRDAMAANLVRLGLLTAKARPRLAAVGVFVPE
jgi:hypothetical protein